MVVVRYGMSTGPEVEAEILCRSKLSVIGLGLLRFRHRSAVVEYVVFHTNLYVQLSGSAEGGNFSIL